MQPYQTCSDEEIDRIERASEGRRRNHLNANRNGSYLGIVLAGLQIEADETYRKIVLPFVQGAKEAYNDHKWDKK